MISLLGEPESFRFQDQLIEKMAAESALDPFQKLLNNLNHELNERNLESLIHVCGRHIPGSQRERISSGWDVFNILRHQNVIGSEREKIHNLLEIIKELRPKRRDLVSLVKQHIRDCYENPETILEDLQSSWEYRGTRLPATSSRSSSPIRDDDCCLIRCCGCFCKCDYGNSCCNACCNACCDACCMWFGAILGGLFFLLAIVAVLAWYSSIPRLTKFLKSDGEIQHAGPLAVGSLAFLAASSIVCAVCVKFRLRRNAGQYDIIPDLPTTFDIQTSFATSESRRTSRSGDSYRSAAPRRIYRGRSCSSGQYTASGSLASKCSRVSSRTPRLVEETDAVPDGFQPDSFWTPRMDVEEDDEIEEV